MTKNIAITDESYNLLVRYKLRGESFSEVIRSHFKKKKTLFDYAGVWADIPDAGWREFEQKIEEARKGLGASIKKRIGALK